LHARPEAGLSGHEPNGREEVWGRDGNTRWLPMLDATYDAWRKVQGPARVTPGAVEIDRDSSRQFGQENWGSYEPRFSPRDSRGLRKLSVVNLEMARLQEMRVEIAIRDLSITTYVDGRLINQATDESFQAGPMAFAAWEARARFSRPEFRVLG
jgi:hypothetical protein